MRRLSIPIIAALSLFSGQLLAQDVKAGERIFSQCKACHQVGEKARNGVGPELNGIVGRKAGALAGFAFSTALKESGIVWDEARLMEFIRDPKAMLAETKMPFDGIKDEQEIRNLIAFLNMHQAAGKRPQ